MRSFARQVSERRVQRVFKEVKGAVWTVSSETMASAIIDATSQTEEHSIVCWMTNLDAVMAWHRIFILTSYLDSVCSIMMIASVFDGIVQNARFQRSFDIVILAHRLEWWDKVPLDTHLSHLSFALIRHFEKWPLHFWCVKTCGSILCPSPAKRCA